MTRIVSAVSASPDGAFGGCWSMAAVTQGDRQGQRVPCSIGRRTTSDSPSERNARRDRCVTPKVGQDSRTPRVPCLPVAEAESLLW